MLDRRVTDFAHILDIGHFLCPETRLFKCILNTAAISEIIFAQRQVLDLLATDMTAVFFSVYNANKSSTMQTSIISNGKATGIRQTLKGVKKSISHRINAISENTFIAVGLLSALSTVICAGCYSATGTTRDLVLLSISAMTALVSLAIADSKVSNILKNF